jgi:hypothetical protein
LTPGDRRLYNWVDFLISRTFDAITTGQVNLTNDNYDTSAAIFGPQVAAWVTDMFCNFYFMKNPKIDNNSITTEAGGIISTLKIVRISEFFTRFCKI